MLRQLQTGGHEHRSFQITDVEIETREAEAGPRITGYASVWDVLSEQIFGFRENFVKGAFRKTIKEGDIRALFNHNPDLILGRTKNKTLALREDQHGLHFDNTPPPTTYANDLLISIRRGDVDQVSIGFEKVKDKWDMDDEGIITRTVSEAKLYDVSPVAFAAYTQTDVQVRSALKKQGVDMDQLTGVLAKSSRGTQLLDNDTDVLRRAAGVIQELLPGEPTQAGHSEEGQRLTELERRFNSMERKIDLILINEG
jgi:HK97 family phage prohead protease